MVKNEGDKYSLAQIQADIYGQEIDDGFNKADGKRKSKKKSKKGKSLKQVNNPATNLYNEVNMTFGKFFFENQKVWESSKILKIERKWVLFWLFARYYK